MTQNIMAAKANSYTRDRDLVIKTDTESEYESETEEEKEEDIYNIWYRDMLKTSTLKSSTKRKKS